jgi:hypothetical protein
MFRDFQSWFNEKLALRRNRRKASVRKTTLAFDNLEERAVMDGAYWNLATQGAFQQDWSNTSQITSDNDWSGVPSITGQSGAGLDKGILSIAQVDDIVTVTTAIGNTNLNSSAAANRFVVGQQVTILGTTNYNGNYTILRAIDQNHFQFKANVTGLPAEFTGTASSTSLSAQAATAVDGKASFVVRANQTNPSSNTNFGVAEFDSLPNPTIALAGDAANPTPFIQINLNTVNSNNIRVQYTLRDLGGSGAAQPIALQYRQDGAGSFGSYSNTGTWRPVDWTNIPGAYVANATNGGSTNVDVILPTTAEGKTFFQLRIITANSTGADQWIGVDDIKVSAVGRINLTNASGSEGDGTVTVTATRTNGSSGAVSATYTTPYAIASATSSGSTATITTSGNHSFAVGQVVTVAGVSVAGYNTNATILSVTPNSFTYTTSTQNLAAGTGGTVTSGSGASSGTATITTSTPSQTDYSASSGVLNFADGQTSQTFTVSVIDNGDNIFGVSAASNSGTTATITTTANHTFVVGQTVTISGVADAAYNGTYVLTAVTGNTITYTVPVAPAGASTGGTVSGAEPAQETVPLALISNNIPIASIATNPNTLTTTVTTSSPHGFSVGQQVVATGTISADTGALIFSGVSSGNTATITTSANHPFIVGQTVTIEGASDAGYNGTVVITAVPATNQFSYTTVGSNLPAATAVGTIVSGTSRAISSITSVAGASFSISAATFAAGVATITTAANHSFVAGQFVVIAGVGAGQYNGTYQILGTPAANQFTYAPYNIPTGSSSGGTASFNTVTLTTSAPHSFGVNSQINVTGSSQAAYNGSFPIVSVTANTITYVIGGTSAPAAAGATGYITSNANVDMYNDMPAGIGGFIITSVTPTSFTFKAQNNRSNNSAIASSAVGGTVRLATAALIGTASSTLNINDNDGAGTVEFMSADYTVGEAKGTAIITLKRTGDTTGGLVVSYATSEDPFAFNAAFAGFDFTQTSGVVAFAPGQTTASFTVPITNDGGLEGPEVFNVALSNLIGGPGASLGAQSTAVVTITEPGSIAINPTTVTVSEGDGFATVTVVRTGSTTGTATVFYSTSNGSATAGSDYTATTGRLVWGDGDNSSKTFQIPITDDTDTAEALSESINVSIANSWNVSSATQSGTTATITTSAAHGFQIGDTVVIRNVSVAGYNGIFTITGTSATTFTYETVGGLLAGSGGTATYDDASIGTANGTVNIIDNDGTGTVQFTAANYSVGEGKGQITLTVTRTGGSAGPLNVGYATSSGTAVSGSDFGSASGVLSWADGDSAPKTFNVSITNDSGTAEGAEDFIVSLLGFNVFNNIPLGAPAAVLGANSAATVTITEPGQIQFASANFVVSEVTSTTTQATITINRVNGSAGPVTVQYSTGSGSATAGSDYTATSGTLFWADGDSAPKTFTIDILDDVAVEATETVPLTLTIGAAITSASQPSGTTVTITTATPHGYVAGQLAVISGVSVGGYNGTFLITSATATTFTYETTAGLAAGTGGLANTLDGPSNGTPTSATLNIGDNDGTGVLSLSSATYTLPENYGPVAVGIVSASSSGNTATITAPNHPFSVGQLVNIAGMNNGNYNGLFAITATTPNTFSYTTTGANLTVGMGAIATLAATITSATAAGNVVTITTSAPHGFLADHQVTVNNLDAGYTGTFTIISATANTFTYVSTGSPAASSAIQATSNAIISAPLAVTVNRTGGSAGTLSVVYTVSGGTAVAGKDYAGVYTNNNTASLLNTTLTFGPGETSKTFFIRPVDNNVTDGNRTVNIALSNVLGGGSLGATSSAVLTITDFEPGRPVFVSSTFNASGASVTITVNRIGGSSGALSANYSTISDTAVAGVDFTAVTGTLTWADGDIAPKTFNVPLLTTFTPGDGKTFKVSLGQTGLGSSAAANPAVWYDFNNDANPLDGRIADNSSTGIPLVHRQRNGNSPTSTFVGMPEQYNSPGGVVSYYLSSGASFPGAGNAFFMEGGLSRTYDTFEPVTGTVVNTTVGGSNSSRNELDVAAQAWIAAGNDSRTYRSALLNSGDNNTGQSAITYTLWMQLPELVGADFNGNKYPNGPNQRSLIGRSSDPGTGDGGIAGQSDFGGQVYINTIPNYRLEPDYDPLNLTGTVKYGFQFRGNTPAGGGSGNSTTTSTTNFKVGEWNQFAFVITPTKIDVYKNGAFSESLNVQMFDALKGSIEDIKGFLSLNFGSISGAAREQGNVNIDDFGVWTSALGASDIQAIYQKGIREAVANTAQVGSDFTPPVITNVSPASGPTAGGTVVTITGNFFTGATSVKFGTTAATSFTVNSGTSITATAPAGTLGTVDIFITTPLGTSTVTPSGKFTYIAAPTVSSVVLNSNNPGLAGAQRSMVNSVVYKFNQAVNLAPGAVSIALRPGITINGAAAANPGVVPTINLSTPDGGLTWIATFSGAGVIGGSIANGVYDLKLNAASVTAVSGGLALAANRNDVFYRLFGDIDGNLRVNAVDYNGFLSTFGLRSNQVGYILAYDVDNSGRVNATDYNGFLFNFGKRFGGFTPTI